MLKELKECQGKLSLGMDIITEEKKRLKAFSFGSP
jgi:hypothetical protein